MVTFVGARRAAPTSPKTSATTRSDSRDRLEGSAPRVPRRSPSSIRVKSDPKHYKVEFENEHVRAFASTSSRTRRARRTSTSLNRVVVEFERPDLRKGGRRSHSRRRDPRRGEHLRPTCGQDCRRAEVTASQASVRRLVKDVSGIDAQHRCRIRAQHGAWRTVSSSSKPRPINERTSSLFRCSAQQRAPGCWCMPGPSHMRAPSPSPRLPPCSSL